MIMKPLKSSSRFLESAIRFVFIFWVSLTLIVPGPVFANVDPIDPPPEQDPIDDECPSEDLDGDGDGDSECPKENDDTPSEDDPTCPPDMTPLPIYLRYGSVVERQTDAILAGPSFSWSHRRSYSSLANVIDSSTLQGNGWANNTTERYLTLNGNDVTVAMSASSQMTFVENGAGYDSPDSFIGSLRKESVTDTKDYDKDSSTTDTIDVFTLTENTTGRVYIFAGFDTDIQSHYRGKLVEESSIYWADDLSLDGARYSYNSSGELTQITTPTGQDYNIDFTYTNGLLTKIEITTPPPSSNLIREVIYTYKQTSYSSDVGSAGDLVQVRVLRRDSADSHWIRRFTQYRYDSDSRVTMVLDHDAIFRAVEDYPFVHKPADLLTKDNDYNYVSHSGHDLQDFASRKFTYYTSKHDTSIAQDTSFGSEDLDDIYGGTNTDEEGMVKSETISPGGCHSCGGSSSVTRDYYYMELNPTSPDQNDVEWLVVEDTNDPNGDGVYRRVMGLNNDGRTLRTARILNPAGTASYWCTSRKMHATLDGRVTEVRRPSAHTDVDTPGELETFLQAGASGNDPSVNDTSGLILTYEYNAAGRRTGRLAKNGETNTAYYLFYTKYGDGTPDKPEHLPVERRVYDTQVSTNPESDGNVTSYTYTFYDTAERQVESRKTTLPTISTDQNGSGVPTDLWEYWDEEGRLRWTKDGEGYVTYRAPHPSFGGLAYLVSDVDTPSLDSEITAPSGDWEAWSGSVPTNFTRDSGLPTALELVTEREFDDQGRRTWLTDPGGGRHFRLYERNQTTEFRYVDEMTGKARLPIQVTEYDDKLDNTAIYEVDSSKGTATGGTPTGFTATQADYVKLTRKTFDTLSGQLLYVDRYHNIPSSGGSLGSDYYRVSVLYDSMGRTGAHVYYVDTNKHQVITTLFDEFGRPTERRFGVTTSAPSDYDDLDDNISSTPSGFNGYATSVTAEYDSGNVGDSHVTSIKHYHDTGNNDYRRINIYRTYRGHLRGAEFKTSSTDITPYYAVDVNWQGRRTALATYTSEPAWSTLEAGYDAWVNDPSGSTGRNYLMVTKRNDLGRIYRTGSYPGAESTNHLETNYYYDRNGRLVCRGDKYSAHVEIVYDGVGRRYQMRMAKDVSAATPFTSGKFDYNAPDPDPNFAAMSGGNDGLIELAHRTYDVSSNVTEQHSVELNHDDTNGFSLTSGKPTGGVRITSHTYFDAADRIITRAIYGTGDEDDGAVTWKTADLPDYDTGDSTTFNSTANRLVMQYQYDDDSSQTDQEGSGRLLDITDFGGSITRMLRDALGRRTFVIENYDNFQSPSTNIGGGTDHDEDLVLGLKYNGLSRTTKLTVYNASSSTSDQVTDYKYEDNYNARLVTKTIYPDGDAADDNVQHTYYLNGRLSTKIDQRGTVHSYSYNNRLQLEFDDVTSLGSTGHNVDGTVRSIGYDYDNLGRLEKITSYNDISTGSPAEVNEIHYTRNSLGLVTKSEQEHDGAAVTGTPDVEYVYDTSLSGTDKYDDGLRLSVIKYPLVADGPTQAAQVVYSYGQSNSVDERLNRVRYHKLWSGDFLTGDEAITSVLQYNGTSRVVNVYYEQPRVRREMFSSGNDYDSFDRFGHTLTQQWEEYAGTASAIDQVDYTYDYAGNQLTRDVNNATSLDQTYTYDGLHRLKTVDEDTSSTTNDRFWKLDQLGNWEVLRNGLTSGSTELHNRTHNSANEIVNIDFPEDEIDPSHDDAGNMTLIPRDVLSAEATTYSAKYDAWNRLVELKEGSVIQANEYDGLNRRIIRDESGGSGEKRHFYYSDRWQVLVETVEDTSETPDAMYSYHPYYLDAVGVRLRDTDAHIYLHDANYNVTAVADDSGNIVERYAYSPYGKVTVLDANFSTVSGNISTIANEYMYTGRRLDPETGMQLNRNRFYIPPLGRWANRDPIEYRGGKNMYAYVGGMPTYYVDPWGLWHNPDRCSGNFTPPCDDQEPDDEWPLDSDGTCNVVCTCPDGSTQEIPIEYWDIIPGDPPRDASTCEQDAKDFENEPICPDDGDDEDGGPPPPFPVGPRNDNDKKPEPVKNERPRPVEGVPREWESPYGIPAFEEHQPCFACHPVQHPHPITGFPMPPLPIPSSPPVPVEWPSFPEFPEMAEGTEEVVIGGIITVIGIGIVIILSPIGI